MARPDAGPLAWVVGRSQGRGEVVAKHQAVTWSRSKVLTSIVAMGLAGGGCGDDGQIVDGDSPGSTVVYETQTLEVFDAHGRPLGPATGEHLPQGDSDEELLRDAAG